MMNADRQEVNYEEKILSALEVAAERLLASRAIIVAHNYRK